MNCNEPMFRDGEDYSHGDCQLKFGHPGAHDYFGEKMPRPVPSGELAPDIVHMINRAAGRRAAWGLDDRTYKIVFEVTTVYAVDVVAESENAALHMYEDLVDLPDFDNSDSVVLDGSAELRRIDYFERSSFTGASFGPAIACPDCGKEAMRREWYHNPFRKCHGPIEWVETKREQTLKWRYRREFKATPQYVKETTS